MLEITDLSTLLQKSAFLQIASNDYKENQLQAIRDQLDGLPTILDKDTLTRLKNGEYSISLKKYTDINTYNTMMSALYGNNSANKFQNTLNILTNSAENELATAKTFVETMRESGMSTKTAVQTFAALQKYSLWSSYGNYNYVNASA